MTTSRFPLAGSRHTPVSDEPQIRPFWKTDLLPVPRARGVLPYSATGQLGSHQDIAPRVALRLGQQTGADALVQTFDGLEFALRLVESRPHYRLGDGAQGARAYRGGNRHIAAPLGIAAEGDGALQRLGPLG